jgi:hypothetical protein
MIYDPKDNKLSKEQIGIEYLASHNPIFEQRHIIKNENVLKSIQDLAAQSEYESIHAPTRTGSWMVKDPLGKLPQAKEYLTRHVYPFNEPIGANWMKWYGVGHYSGLHQDHEGGYAKYDKSGRLWYITSIIIKSNGMEGGQLIIAGDSSFNDTERASRMMVLDITEPGWGACWNMFTLHGVSHITAGERITLMIAKRHPKHLKADLEKKQNYELVPVY